MRVVLTDIPPGSQEIAVWADLPPGELDEGQEIDTVCNLWRVSEEVCMVTKAKGILSDEINVAIGLRAIQHGYKIMLYAVATDSSSSRRGKHMYTADGMDHYVVDLLRAAEELGR